MKGQLSLSEEQTVKDMREFLDSHVENHSIPFERGAPKNFAAWLVRIYTFFALPSVLDHPVTDALEVKCLYSLWYVR